MAVIPWGRPKLEFGVSDGSNVASWTEMPNPQEDSAQLTTTKGTKQTAKGEGGETVDVRYNANEYSFEFKIFVKKGEATRPIEDSDGVVAQNYGIRLTPEDPTLEGWIMPYCNVSVSQEWASANGTLITYTFEGLKPVGGGKILQPYFDSVGVTPTSLAFIAAGEGKTATVTTPGAATVVSSQAWLTASISGATITATAAANAGAARTATITVTQNGNTAVVNVTQAAA